MLECCKNLAKPKISENRDGLKLKVMFEDFTEDYLEVGGNFGSNMSQEPKSVKDMVYEEGREMTEPQKDLEAGRSIPIKGKGLIKEGEWKTLLQQVMELESLAGQQVKAIEGLKKIILHNTETRGDVNIELEKCNNYKGRPKRCNNCKQVGHYARKCRNPPTCNVCRQVGHFARNCWVRRNKDLEKTADTRSEERAYLKEERVSSREDKE